MAVVNDISGEVHESASRLTQFIKNNKISTNKSKTGSPYKVLVCKPDHQTITGFELNILKDDISVVSQFSISENSSEHLSEISKNLPIVLVLPKRIYLTRVFELPVSEPGELFEMIRLEAEASLPSDYGSIEVSYRQLPATEEQTTVKPYEVYLLKTSLIDQYIQTLAQQGLQCEYILPSAVFWDLALDQRDETESTGDDLLISPVNGSAYETAHRSRQGGVIVRHLDASAETELRQRLIESVRVMHSEIRLGLDDSGPIRIGYLHQRPPAIHPNGHVQMLDRTPAWSSKRMDSDAAIEPSGLLSMAASVWANHRKDSIWQTVNLVPRSVRHLHQRRTLYRQVGISAACFAGTLGLVWLSLIISTWRYNHQVTKLDESISRIQVEGESVGDRLAQLEAVFNARKTRDDFTNIVVGLHEADKADGELSYSQVDLREDGSLLLRGQAESLALPFELPQQLEKLPSMSNVVLRDAGQAKKGAGSVTEFRVEAVHRRGDKQ